MTFEDYELRTTPPAGSGRYLDISGKSRRTEEPVDSFQILQPKLHEFGNFHQVNPTLKKRTGINLQCFFFGFPLLSIVFHYFSKLFPISIKYQSDVNMK
jgi:hypothetical protein